MKEDIPAYAYIEQQILGRAVSSGSLESHIRDVESEYCLPSGFLRYGLFWETRLLSLLYTLILFPKEHWKLDRDDPIYGHIEQKWCVSAASVITQDEKFGSSVYGFVHRLRNALAHARIEFNENEIRISDARNVNGQEVEVFCARITKAESEKFLETVGSILANLRNRSTK